MDGYGNVTGIINGNRSGSTLLFDAHTDTVGVAPGVHWGHDPFSGEISDGRLYGRGASDMKGALVAMMVGALAVDRERLAGKIVISASVLEEVLEGVALQKVMDKHHPDYVVIGEASDLHLVHGGRGRAEISVETIGKPAHTSTPHQGINAAQIMVDVIRRIRDFVPPTHPSLGEGVMVLTDMISEPYPGHSVIPSRSKATYDRRLVPGETRESVLGDFQRLSPRPGSQIKVGINEGEYGTFTGQRFKKEKWFPAWILRQDHPFIQTAAQGLSAAGLPVRFDTYRFCTNAAYSIGVAGVPTIGFGPSRESLVHIVDEYIEVDQLVKAARCYKEIAQALLS
jgi:putative selenium metabolism hydrolase